MKFAIEEPCAKWVPDAQGKWDYDGPILSITTRYWPSPSYGDRASASTSIVLNFGEPDQYGYGETRPWRKADFEADTEEECKALVEAWVRERFEEVKRLLGMDRT